VKINVFFRKNKIIPMFLLLFWKIILSQIISQLFLNQESWKNMFHLFFFLLTPIKMSCISNFPFSHSIIKQIKFYFSGLKISCKFLITSCGVARSLGSVAIILNAISKRFYRLRPSILGKMPVCILFISLYSSYPHRL